MTTTRWYKGRGDRLPMFAAQVLDLYDNPLNLVGAQAWLGLIPAQFDIYIPSGQELANMWTEVPLAFYDAPNGIVFYDWQQLGADIIPPGVYRLAVRAITAAGLQVTTPTDGRTELVVWE
jgi:hypothetical protein